MKRRGPQKDQAKRFDWKKVRTYGGEETVDCAHHCRVIMRDGIALEPIPRLAPPPQERSKILDSISPINGLR